jgi:DNA-binding NarL/FixJ family response regulator
MRVVIAEDLFLLRDGLIRMLDAHGFEVVSAVDTGAGLLKAVDEHHPDAAVVDVRLPPTFTDEGLRAALEARRRVPNLPVLVLSQYVEPIYARELLADGTGGVGYLLKDRVFDSAQFAEALRRVASGGTAMDPEVISRLLARNADDSELGALSPARAGGTGTDGRGPVQRGDRAADGDHRAGCREAHLVHLHQTAPASLRR